MLDLVKRRRGRAPSRTGGPEPRSEEPLAVGQRVRDLRLHRQGSVIDVARQYAHPKAAPVFHYLVRWDDGQIQAFGEEAFVADHGIDLID